MSLLLNIDGDKLYRSLCAIQGIQLVIDEDAQKALLPAMTHTLMAAILKRMCAAIVLDARAEGGSNLPVYSLSCMSSFQSNWISGSDIDTNHRHLYR